MSGGREVFPALDVLTLFHVKMGAVAALVGGSGGGGGDRGTQALLSRLCRAFVWASLREEIHCVHRPPDV